AVVGWPHAGHLLTGRTRAWAGRRGPDRRSHEVALVVAGEAFEGCRMTVEVKDAREQEVLASVPKQLLIGGTWRDAEGGATLGVEDPATGEQLVEVADATPADAIAALAAAAEKQAEWAQSAPRDRGEILRAAYEKIVARADELALLMTLEMGKSLA